MITTKPLIKAALNATIIALALWVQAPTTLAKDPPNIEITFTKWLTTYPEMAGFVGGDVVGDFAGTLLKREVLAGGNIVQLEALYGIDAGEQSFVAHIQGTENLQTLHAVLNGEIVDGWMTGAQVHVVFDVVSCEGHPLCFEGTIRIMPNSAD